MASGPVKAGSSKGVMALGARRFFSSGISLRSELRLLYVCPAAASVLST
jgi:hypothetical protein